MSMIFSKDKPLKVFEAFAGYGSQAMALERLQHDFPEFAFDVVGISEIDKYAITAYNAVHGETVNYGDIGKIDWAQVPDFDLLTYSFPCTDISAAGQQQGFTEGSGTRSSLLWECRKAIEAKRPPFLLMENVAALVQQKFLPLFNQWRSELHSYGYDSWAEILNAKDYGIPQNRDRVFMVSIHRSVQFGEFHFPAPFKLERFLADVLDKQVDERYYLKDEQIQSLLDDVMKEVMERNNLVSEDEIPANH